VGGHLRYFIRAKNGVAVAIPRRHCCLRELVCLLKLKAGQEAKKTERAQTRKLTYKNGRAVAQAVSRRFSTAVSQVPA
jgi:hypothetical protein